MEVKDEEDRVKAHTQHANGATSSINNKVDGSIVAAGSGSQPSSNGDGNQTKTKTNTKTTKKASPVAAIPPPKRKHGMDKGLSCFRS